MNRTLSISLLILALGGALHFGGRGPSRPLPDTPTPPSSIVITIDDPGEAAAVKFMALYAAGLAPEAEKFAQRLRDNPTSNEFAGPGPAAEAWREIAQDVLRASQQGLSNKILDIQDRELGWNAAADYLQSAAKGWNRAASTLNQIPSSR